MRRGETTNQPTAWTTYKHARKEFFRFRHEASFLESAAMAAGFAALTGIAAQVRIPLPFSPVPITLQTFAVLLAGIVLGMRFGGVSQGMYIGGGIAGVPWFQGFGAGLGHLAGPTGGYLVGFVVAALAIGYLVDRYPITRRLVGLCATLFVANAVIIYGLGLSWLYLWTVVVTGGSATVGDVLVMGLYPFVPGDIVKLIAAAAIGSMLLPNPDNDLLREA